MESKAYLIEVLRTVSPHNTPKTNLLGLRGETGEVADVVKKVIGHAQGWGNGNADKLIKELGDSCWYAVAAMIKILGEEVTAGVMNSRFLITEDLENLADMLCEAGSKIGHATFPFEAHDAGQEFFAIIHTIVHYHLPEATSVGAIWEANVAKLRKRYPEGFTTAASVAKADESVKADSFTPMEQAFERRSKLSGEHQARHGCLGVPAVDVDDYATAGNGYRAPCDTCDQPHHISETGK